MKKLRAKLKSKSGETIGEVLVALLISALALLMLAGAITSSSKLITASRTKQAEYYGENDALSSMAGEGTGGSVVLKENGTTIGDIGSSGISIRYYENDEISKKPVISYKKTPTPTPGP